MPPTGPGIRRWTGEPSAFGALMRLIRARRVQQAGRQALQPRQGEQPDVCQGVIDPRSTERTHDDDPVRAQAQGRPDRELGVRLILLR